MHPAVKKALVLSGVGLVGAACGSFLTLLGLSENHRTAYCPRSGRLQESRTLKLWGMDLALDGGKKNRASEVTWVLEKNGYPTSERRYLTMSERTSSVFFSGQARTTDAKSRFESLNQCESIAGLHALFSWNKARGKYLLELLLSPGSQSGRRIGATTVARFAQLTGEKAEELWQTLVKEFGLRDAP